MPTAPSVSSPGDDWRRAFGDYLDATASTAAPAAPPFTDLALQFELRELTPRTTYRWNGPTSRAVDAKAGGDVELGTGDLRLSLRPVTRTARGWARGSLTWTNLPHQLNRLNLDPAQHRWFCQFVALDRAGETVQVGRDPDWVYLDEFQNPVLWTMLDQASTLGIALVGSSPGVAIRRATRARLSLDAVRSDGGVRVTPMLKLDDVIVDPLHARAIGAHGIYAFDLSKPQRFTLAPTGEALTEAQRAILAGSTPLSIPIAVPEAGAQEFITDYLPDLRDLLDVESSDASVPVPAPTPPTLVLSATFGPRNSLDLAWHWDRRRGAPDVPRATEVLPDGLLPEAWLEGGRAAPMPVELVGIDAAEFAATVMPQIAQVRGVRVETHGRRPDYRELTGTPLLTVTTVPTERHDWFDLGVVVTVDGRDIPFVPLFRALASARRKLLLIDGSYISLTHPAFAPLRELIDEAKDLDEWETGRPRISRYQTSLWADFEDLADQSVPAVEWRALLADVSDAPRTVEPPVGLHADLRQYQAEGLAWLVFLWRHQLGAILADDMGLGKTLQCLALIQHVAESAVERRPFLVVAPTSVVGNWVAEADRFTPGLVVREISATQAASAQSIAETAIGADIVVTSYALLRLDVDAYQAVATSTGWSGLILDEAQFVKNAASRVHEAARDLDVRFKLAVTGTPMENSLSELHALFAIVAPGLFPSARRFTEEYVRPIEDPTAGITRGRGAGTAPEVAEGLRSSRLIRLRRRIRPFMLRRTKELVAAELPAKQEQTLTIELAPEHRALYDVHLQRERQKLFGLLEDLDRHRFIVFRSLTLLRLLALDASLLGEEHADVPSSKLDALFEQLDDVVAEGHRALIFSQFTSYLRKAAARLEAAGIAYVYLDGSTRRRSTVIDEFKTGTAPVFLISLKAGGFGLNLTEADYVFLLDPWWNPASEDQAIDRTHRIGQTRNVMVYRLIAAGTIEEKVMQLKARKSALFDAVIDDDELFSSALSADDIRELLT